MLDRPWWAARTSTTSRARAWTARGVIGAVVALSLLTLSGAAAVRGLPTAEVRSRGGVETVPADVEALLAGCGPVRIVLRPNTVVGWVETDSVLSYQTPVPAAGWFDPQPPQPGDISPRPESVLRAMWSGERALWVDPHAGADALDSAHSFTSAHPDLGLRVFLWPQQYQRLPRTYVLALWGITQECQELDRAVLDALLRQAPASPGTPGQQPPPAFDSTEDGS